MRILGLTTVWAFSSIAAGDVIYVRSDAEDGGNGRSWERAFASLQEALGVARAGDELWVAEGVYTPADPGGDRNTRFVIPDAVAVLGGFSGTETRKDERDPLAHPTVLSGDLNQDDQTGGDASDNAYHVVEASAVGEDTILDGLTITCGNADGAYPRYFGGGLLCYFGQPTVYRCIFTGNYAVYGGGLSGDGASPYLIECTFADNTADVGGGAMVGVGGRPLFWRCTFSGNRAGTGGGLVLADNADGGVLFCRFTRNRADSLGAGAHVVAAAPHVIGCTFEENEAPRGGGLSSLRGDPRLVSTLFLGNRAFEGSRSGTGGGVYISNGNPQLINCTLAENASYRGGGLFAQLADVALTNCILWGNTNSDGGGEAAQFQWVLSELLVNYCCIEGYDGTPSGTGNIAADPLLDGQGRITAGSAAIDAANNLALPADVFDLDADGDRSEPLPLDAAAHARRLDDPGTADSGAGTPPLVDMGAFELHCTGREALKASCAAGAEGFTVKGIAKNGQPGAEVMLTLDGAEQKVRVFGAGGKAKATWKHIEAGPHEVTLESACGRIRSAATQCK